MFKFSHRSFKTPSLSFFDHATNVILVVALSTPVINFTNKDNLHTCEVDMPFWPLFCESEAILSKKFRPGYRDCENIFSPVRPRSRDLGNQASPPSHMNTPKCLQRI